MDKEKPKYYSPSQNRATQKYLAVTREKLQIWLIKGDKTRLDAAARAAGMSVTQYVVAAVNEYAHDTILTPSRENMEHD